MKRTTTEQKIAIIERGAELLAQIDNYFELPRSERKELAMTAFLKASDEIAC